MKLLLVATLVVSMSVGTLHANVEDTAAPEVVAEPPVQTQTDTAPATPAQPPVQAADAEAPVDADAQQQEPKKPRTLEEALSKLSPEQLQNAELVEEIKRDAAKRAAIPVIDPSQQPADRLGAPNIAYDRTQRFIRPMDRIVEFRNAQNVVTNEVHYNSLPESIRLELQGILGACPQNTKNIADLKSYSYVSDLQRTRGLSPNYFIDFSKLKSNNSEACAATAPCNDEGCLFISFNTIGYRQWKKDTTIRAKEWAMRQVDDQSASAVPQSKKPAIVSYFDFTTQCKDTAEAECHTHRIWLSGGLGSYTPPQ